MSEEETRQRTRDGGSSGQTDGQTARSRRRTEDLHGAISLASLTLSSAYPCPVRLCHMVTGQLMPIDPLHNENKTRETADAPLIEFSVNNLIHNSSDDRAEGCIFKLENYSKPRTECGLRVVNHSSHFTCVDTFPWVCHFKRGGRTERSSGERVNPVPEAYVCLVAVGKGPNERRLPTL
ncbi:hypothetical protein J6590_021628 [Homalodisca vitripennis]|nr:hypothetical protein J6590_021628 [Homalodisca vitripennis]